MKMSVSNLCCSGNGECLLQDEINSYTKNIEFQCDFKCIPKKCPNYIICEELAPEWFFNCHNGTCMNCAIRFKGELIFTKDNTDCPICLECKMSVKHINCKHTICIECFKKCFACEDVLYPVFPYNDQIQLEWEEDPDNERWEKYPLIKSWNAMCIKIDNECEEKYEEQEYLRKCPMCRC